MYNLTAVCGDKTGKRLCFNTGFMLISQKSFEHAYVPVVSEMLPELHVQERYPAHFSKMKALDKGYM